ncbi:hypothetical protein PSTG_17792, partial [Puccinia striiformis f. sp. tritici PST-78]
MIYLELKALKYFIRSNVEQNVELKVNVNLDSPTSLLSQSLVGISMMVDEHFGISIVKFMALGLIPSVNRLGGPLLDIVVKLPITEDSPNKNNTEQQASTRDTGHHANGIVKYSAQLEH